MMPGPEPETTAEDILEQFIMSPEPAFVPAEIADVFDISKEGARHRLERLVEDNYLDKKKPGERTVLYWVTDTGRRHYAEMSD